MTDPMMVGIVAGGASLVVGGLGMWAAMRGTLYTRLTAVESVVDVLRCDLDECREDRHWLRKCVQLLQFKWLESTGEELKMPPSPRYREDRD